MNCKVRSPYTNIVLAIPHSGVERPEGAFTDLEANPVVARERDRFTDWFTDELFSDARDGISSVQEPFSRYYCDVERLEWEQDRICKHRLIDGTLVPASARHRMLAEWFEYRARLMVEAARGERPLIIDCHSFPSDLAPDVDVCIGFNEDESRPSDDVLAAIAMIFEKAGFAAAFNSPYANAIAPVGYVGHSIMIEANKRCYLDEAELGKGLGFGRLSSAIRCVYSALLA